MVADSNTENEIINILDRGYIELQEVMGDEPMVNNYQYRCRESAIASAFTVPAQVLNIAINTFSAKTITEAIQRYQETERLLIK